MKNKKYLSAVILAIVFTIVVLIFDLVTKYVIEANLSESGSADFLPGFINFVLVHNDGAAWNIFSGQQIFLIILTFVFIAVFLAFFIFKCIKAEMKVSKLFGISVGLIIGGCLGNLFDRIAFGYVRDFLNFQFINFPVFNIADISLCLGILLLVIYLIFIMPKEKGNKNEN